MPGRPVGHLIFSPMASITDPVYKYLSKGFRGQPSINPVWRLRGLSCSLGKNYFHSSNVRSINRISLPVGSVRPPKCQTSWLVYPLQSLGRVTVYYPNIMHPDITLYNPIIVVSMFFFIIPIVTPI